MILPLSMFLYIATIQSCMVFQTLPAHPEKCFSINQYRQTYILMIDNKTHNTNRLASVRSLV